MKEGGKPRDEERRKAGKGKEGKKENHEGFDTQVRNISTDTQTNRPTVLIVQFPPTN